VREHQVLLQGKDISMETAVSVGAVYEDEDL
jgi:hypothetical protein